MDASTARSVQMGHDGPSAPAVAPRVRHKRSQVSRACDGCRMHRIKCDNNYPCANCHTRGRQCSNTETTRTSTLSQAHDEITRLKQRIKDLEGELRSARARPPPEVITPTSLPSSQESPSPLPAVGTSGPSPSGKKFQVWEGVKLCPARAPNESWFGPSSLYFFLQRLNSSLTSVLPPNLKPDRLFLTSTTNKRLLEGPVAGNESQGLDSMGKDLNPMQEQYFLDLYWHSFHTTILPIIDEAEFKEYYQSLWSVSGTTRKSSALVDAILALCMQLDMATGVSQAYSGDNADATVAGRWHYRRCQALLAQEMESPSMTTLQCHLLSAVYLCGGSFHNMVDMAVGQAARTAYILGLHVDAPAGTPRKEVEKRRRLWWTVYLLESMICMKLGRPFQLRDSHVMPEIPGDDFEAATLSGSRFAPIGKTATWLSFNVNYIKLYRVVREAQLAFYYQDVHVPTGRTMWDDVETLESHAELLLPYTKPLQEWASAVPTELLTQHSNGGKTFSTDPSPLEVERFAPVWLQRQRIWLEIAYHNVSITLYKPFISFSAQPQPGGTAEKLANDCAAHAIAFTKLLHQTLSSTITLNGIYDIFHFQWSIAMTLVGFVLAYPDWPLTPAARQAIDTAVAVFDLYGKQYIIAPHAAAIMRELCVKIDHVNGQRLARLQHQTSSLVGGEQPNGGVPQLLSDPVLDVSMSDMALTDGVWDGSGQNLFDMALDVDFWDQMNGLWPDYGMGSNSALPQQQFRAG